MSKQIVATSEVIDSIKFLIESYERAHAYDPIIDLYGDTHKAIDKIKKWMDSPEESEGQK